MKNFNNIVGSAVVVTSLAIGASPAAGAITNPIYVSSDDVVAGSVALVNIPHERANFVTLCTGSLIHQEWVITAAHCLGSNNDYIPGGEFVTNKLIDSFDSEFYNNDDTPFRESGIFNVLSSGSSFTIGGYDTILPDSPEDDVPENPVLPNNPVEEEKPIILEKPKEDNPIVPVINSNRLPFVTFGPIRNGGEEFKVTHVYSHPDSADGIDIALLKLDRPASNVPVLKMSDTTLEKGSKTITRTYGWSDITNTSNHLRYLEGESSLVNGRNITIPLNGSNSENGDSGGPVVNGQGELVSIHSGTITSTNYRGTYGYTIDSAKDWIDIIISTK